MNLIIPFRRSNFSNHFIFKVGTESFNMGQTILQMAMILLNLDMSDFDQYFRLCLLRIAYSYLID